MVQKEASLPNRLWAELVVEELVRQGISRFFVSPGSRSTPLTAALAVHEGAEKTVHFDERGAAFAALGYARAAGKPAGLVCSSGTAAANYFPAVIEAAMDRIPLVVLTADRPPELRDAGANQTIDQVHLYGKYSRFHFDFPCADPGISPAFILTTVDQAVYRATNPLPGPVHLNFMFREPLVPADSATSFSEYLFGVKNWRHSKTPYTRYTPPARSVNPEEMDQLASLLKGTEHGLLILGQLKDGAERGAAFRLAQRLNWPVFADIRSGLRLGNKAAPFISYFDQLLLADSFKQLAPSVVVHLGGNLTSKRMQLFLENSSFDHYLHIADHPLRLDPGHRVSQRIEADISLFCDAVIERLSEQGNHSFLERFKRADQLIHDLTEDLLIKNGVLSEPGVARLISRNIVEESVLFLGNSMPVRDMDMYADPGGNPVAVAANRGASGIDGSLATAWGFALGSRKPGTLLIGDLSLLHDLNSLALLKQSSLSLTVVVINNNGGGIFSFLPIAEYQGIFEPFFATPHDLGFEKAALMFGLDYYRPKSLAAFSADYREAQLSEKSSLIEVVTDRTQNLDFHQAVQEKIKVALDELAGYEG